MKYAVIAALLATCNAAAAVPTGCKKGITAKRFSDSKCKDKATSEHNFLEKDMEKTGTCQSHKATATDLKAVEVSQNTLVDSQKAATKATKDFQRTSALDISIGDSTDTKTFQKDPAPEMYKEEYPALKKAYGSFIDSKAVYDDYKLENKEKETGIEAYKKEYKEWYELTQVKEADQVDANIKKAKTEYKEAAKQLPKPEDAKIVNAHVANEYAWSHTLDTTVGDGTNTEFSNQESDNRVLVVKFLALDVANDKAQAALAAQENVVKQAAGKVDAHTFATFTTCDAKAGVVIKTYDDADCTAKEPESEFVSKWNGCVKWGDEYVKVTGAAALKAAAVAVVAFAGSQF